MKTSLLPYNPEMIRVPVYSQIAAGPPFQETSQIGWRWIRVPRNYRPGQQICAVRIIGESLIEAAILSGDYAICRLTAEIERNGQLAAVLIGEGLTLKYTYFDPRGGVWLRGASTSYVDKYYEPGEAIIQAVVVRVERDM